MLLGRLRGHPWPRLLMQGLPRDGRWQLGEDLVSPCLAILPACCYQVCPEAGAREDSPRKSMDVVLEEPQLPPSTEGPLQQVGPWAPAKAACGQLSWQEMILLHIEPCSPQ